MQKYVGTLGLISVGDKYGYHLNRSLIHGSLGDLLEPVLGFTVVVGLTMLFIVGDMVIERYKVGMLNIPIAYGRSREKIYLSNLIVILGTVVGLGLLMIGAAATIWATLYTTDYTLSKEELKKIIEVMGTWCLIMMAMTSSWVLIATIIGEKALVVGMGILDMTFISGTLIMGVGQSVIEKVPILMLMQLCTGPQSNMFLGAYRIYSVLIICLTTLTGCIVFRKQDIQ